MKKSILLALIAIHALTSFSLSVPKKLTRTHVLTVEHKKNPLGWVRLKIKAPAGTNIKLPHAEVLDKNGNFLDVPTDCPQRNERLGWTGDAQAFAPTACFNMDCAAFYTEWLQDLAAEQYDDGVVPLDLNGKAAGNREMKEQPGLDYHFLKTEVGSGEYTFVAEMR
jgi:hypothetical protein